VNILNQDLHNIMRDKDLSSADVAKVLGVSVETVESWIITPGSTKKLVQMPDLDLRVLQYSLMTENTRYHLF
jgi:DNA-binding transcriptional regulator YiaG